MRKRCQSGITVNNMPLESIVEEQGKQPSPDTMEVFETKHFVYHNPRSGRIRTRRERNGPVMSNYMEIHKRNRDGHVIRQITEEKNLAKAMIAVLLASNNHLTGSEMVNIIDQILINYNKDRREQYAKFYGDYQVRAAIARIMKSELFQFINIQPATTRTRKRDYRARSYLIVEDAKQKYGFGYCCTMLGKRLEKLEKKEPKEQPVPPVATKETEDWIKELALKVIEASEHALDLNVNLNVNITFSVKK